jgi:hypothetical protein
LIFIGLWSYVDDNGVGRDVEKLILADLFPLEDDPRDTLARLSRGLRKLEQGGQITRYIVDGKPYLHITAWTDHQKIDHPSKRDRYPLPTCDDAAPRPPDGAPSRESRETLAPGEGEKGNRGGEESPSPEPAALTLVTADAATARPKRPSFDDFWAPYPRKVGKDDARKAWEKAVKVRKVDPTVIVAGAKRFAADPHLPAKQFIPHPSTWLARGGWQDEPCPATGTTGRFTNPGIPEGW